MFVTCHITFGQPSNFVGGSLEVTRTIRNNKPHFTWGCSILLSKKKKRALRPDSFFSFSMILMFFLSILIQIITYLEIHYSQNIFCGFSILVYKEVQVFFRGFFFFTPPLARDSLSHSPRTCLRFTEKRWKIAPVLQNQASLMKLRVHGFLFLVFLHIKTGDKNKLFFFTSTSTFRWGFSRS